MKGKNLIKTPGELYAPTQNGVVVSADGVMDYKQSKSQEDINDEVVEKVKKALADVEYVKQTNDLTANIIALLEAHGSDDLGTILNLNQAVGLNTSRINELEDQLNDYHIEVISEDAYNELEEKNQDTLYFIKEED